MAVQYGLKGGAAWGVLGMAVYHAEMTTWRSRDNSAHWQGDRATWQEHHSGLSHLPVNSAVCMFVGAFPWLDSEA